MKRTILTATFAALFALSGLSAQFVPSGNGKGYGPRDGSGYQGKGPKDGTGYGAKSGKRGPSSPDCDGTGPKRPSRSGNGGSQGRGRR
jgi:hypothetical protein